VQELEISLPPSFDVPFQLLGGHGLQPGQSTPLARLKKLHVALLHTYATGLIIIQILGSSLAIRRLIGYSPLEIRMETYEFDKNSNDRQLFSDLINSINDSGEDTITWGGA
jgi:hypothetical protein